MHLYHCYGLTIASDLALPELNPAYDNEPKVHIHRGLVDPAGLAEGDQVGPFLQAAEQQLWLKIPEVACFLIKNGNEIVYDPVPGIDDDSVRVFMLGSCLGALLFQQGYLVLHGNAFRVGDECVICVGHSGAGKSTLAAAMMQRGHAIIADDVCPIDEQGLAISGMPRIKLWQDSADKLGIATEGLARIRPELDKFNYPLGQSFCEQALPVKAVYILNAQKEDQTFRSEPLVGMDKFNPLKANTYRFQYMQGMKLDKQHLQRVSQLAARIQISRVYRPRGSFLINELADFILDDIQQLTAHS